MDRCFRYLTEQTFKDFEIIVVDDCSTDNTLSYLQKYVSCSALDIKIIHNDKNLGPGKSRNVGIKNASGEWLTFCDADDWYPEDRFEKMLAVSENVDCVICNYSKVYHNGKTKKCDYLSNIRSKALKEDIIALALMSLCVCMIKKEIAVAEPIADLYNGEDYATVPLWFQRCDSIAIITDSLYFYFMRDGSASRKPSVTAYINLKKAFDYMAERSYDCYKDSVEFLGVFQILYGGVLVALKAGVKKTEVEKYVATFESDYPDWSKNKYIRYLSKSKRVFVHVVKNGHYGTARIMAYLHGLILRLR